MTDEATAFAVVDDLVIATQMETSLFPQDINDTITSLTNVIDFLSMTLDQTGMADANEVSSPLILQCTPFFCPTPAPYACTPYVRLL